MHFSLIPIVQMIGYPGLFAVVFLESGVFFGFFLPGASMLFTAGLLASQGFFDIWILVPLLTIAAILGDNVGYWFGARVGVRLFLRPNSRFFRHQDLERAKDFYEKYGTRTVFLARFIPIVRTFVPIIAGIVKMNYRTFVSYNVIGAITWAAGVTYMGFVLGEKFPLTQKYLSLIVMAIIIITTIPLFTEYIKRKNAD